MPFISPPLRRRYSYVKLIKKCGQKCRKIITRSKIVIKIFPLPVSIKIFPNIFIFSTFNISPWNTCSNFMPVDKYLL